MKITSAQQKALLSNLFYEQTDGRYHPIQFPFDKLADAASAAKKLAEGSTVKDGRITYVKKTIDFTPSEAAILNDLFEKHKDKWDVTVADTVMELHALFHAQDS